MSEEQKEKWYNSFTREQLIERCEYLQRSCERKEDSIMELEMECADLESIIKEVREYIKDIQNSMWHDDEEDKKIEKLESFGLVSDNPMMNKVIALIANKIDEIIDYLNKEE